MFLKISGVYQRNSAISEIGDSELLQLGVLNQCLHALRTSAIFIQ